VFKNEGPAIYKRRETRAMSRAEVTQHIVNMLQQTVTRRGMHAGDPRRAKNQYIQFVRMLKNTGWGFHDQLGALQELALKISIKINNLPRHRSDTSPHARQHNLRYRVVTPPHRHSSNLNECPQESSAVWMLELSSIMLEHALTLQYSLSSSQITKDEKMKLVKAAGSNVHNLKGVLKGYLMWPGRIKDIIRCAKQRVRSSLVPQQRRDKYEDELSKMYEDAFLKKNDRVINQAYTDKITELEQASEGWEGLKSYQLAETTTEPNQILSLAVRTMRGVTDGYMKVHDREEREREVMNTDWIRKENRVVMYDRMDVIAAIKRMSDELFACGNATLHIQPTH